MTWKSCAVGMRNAILRNYLKCELLVNIQCISDIPELRIRLLYKCILRICKCQYAHVCVYMRIYVCLLCIPILFSIWSIVGQTKDILGMKTRQASKAKFAYYHITLSFAYYTIVYLEFSITLLIHRQTTVYLHSLGLKLPKMGRKLKQSLKHV